MCYWMGHGPGESHEVPADAPLTAYKYVSISFAGVIRSPRGTVWRRSGLALRKPLSVHDGHPESRGVYCFKAFQSARKQRGRTKEHVVRLAISGQVIEHQGRKVLRGYGYGTSSGYRAQRARVTKVWTTLELADAVRDKYPGVEVVAS